MKFASAILFVFLTTACCIPGGGQQPAAQPIGPKQTIGVEVVRLYESSRIGTDVECRIINNGTERLDHVSVQVELQNVDGEYLGMTEIMVSEIAPGGEKIGDRVVLDVSRSDVSSYVVRLDAVVDGSGRRADERFEIELVE